MISNYLNLVLSELKQKSYNGIVDHLEDLLKKKYDSSESSNILESLE